MASLIKYDEQHRVGVYRADKNDVNGNSRVVVHFLDFLGEKEHREHDILTLFDMVHLRLKGSGWRKFHNKEFGGGFIRQYAEFAYNADEVVKNVISYRR